ncbi:hypothetical protein GCM10007391_20830 [Alteromonas halophila]|uniref:Exosortase/archaeosortase family protein n=2 Tax=Alteromonas halophila TaxID=516698 RepID=A0A918JM77_9ALTE|nr:hypothetical protein GCM10007391_20830 [Alteromonas halophila]
MLSSLLQTLSVLVVSNIMGLTGIPVYVESVFVQIPSGTFEIADGCSGLRYMIVSLAISSIYIFMFIRSTSSAIKLVLLSILGALVTNWVRIAALIVIGHITEMQSSLMEDHNMFGWYLYIPFMFIFYYVANRLSDKDAGSAPATAVREDGIAGVKLYAGLAGIVLFMGLSGTTLSHEVSESSVTSLPLAVQPQIYYASEVEQTTASVNGNEYQKLSYYFDGKTLDGKPSYYENQLLPDDWQVEQRTISDGYVQLLLINPRDGQYAQALYQYRFAGNTYARLGALKRARIQRALLSSAKTQIDWLWRLCSAQCKDSLAPE